ncbi:MAG: chemotaxis protein CheB [Pseudomonadota bacterium]|nr:chemotaxis protein CheB [Pseudomonadota bacterium]MDE3037670.1 chemotaxis protein CheB [Pseudomonadota bacterium]
MPYEAIVIGVSAGGLQALKILLPVLPASFPLPIAVVQHIGERSDGFLATYLNQISKIMVKEAEDKEPLCSGIAYLAPPGYHLLIEPGRIFGLSVDARINYSCPSIDVLFESAAHAFGESLIGIVLTGANADGAQGLKIIRAYGRRAIVQNPKTAEAAAMPQAALAATKADYVVDLEQIAPLLLRLAEGQSAVSDEEPPTDPVQRLRRSQH